MKEQEGGRGREGEREVETRRRKSMTLMPCGEAAGGRAGEGNFGMFQHLSACFSMLRWKSPFTGVQSPSLHDCRIVESIRLG